MACAPHTGLARLALLKTDLQADLRAVAAEVDAMEPRARQAHEERRHLKRQRLQDLEKSWPLEVCQSECSLIATERGLRQGEEHLQCRECGRYVPEAKYRRHANGPRAKPQRCPACEFPQREACEKPEWQDDGPVEIREKEKKPYGRREAGPWYCADPACQAAKPRPCQQCECMRVT